VQGVFFRATAQEEAAGLGLAGWVRNRRDGSVELVAEGPLDALERICAWARHGPVHARVDELERVDSEPVDLEPGFVVRPTA
jgi:acylphosphatase